MRFNRTRMELKQQKGTYPREGAALSFNRTRMELKHPFACFNPVRRKALIGPGWN